MNVLVTGGAGFIGSNFARYWVRQHPDDSVIVYDSLTYAGNMLNLAGVEDLVEVVVGDICDEGAVRSVIEDNEIELIVHFAAESHNSLAVVEPGRFFRTNVIGTYCLLDAARRAGVKRFHHVSTCEVYGDLPLDSEESFTEESPYRPRTPYNASKAGADHAVRAYYETFGLPITITNTCNNYGPYQFPEKVIPLFATNALDRVSLPLYSSVKNRREWLHVEDHCSALDMVIENGRIGETYNIGSGREATIEELARKVIEVLGAPEDLLEIVPDRPGHDRRYLLDSSKIKRELGWVPKVDFDEGIAETVEWYRHNRPWWEALKQRAPVDESSWK